MDKFFQNVKQKIRVILPKMFHSWGQKNQLLNLFYKANKFLLLKLDKSTKIRENYRPTSLMHINAQSLNEYEQIKPSNYM